MHVLLLVSDPRDQGVALASLQARGHFVVTALPGDTSTIAARDPFDLLVVEAGLIDQIQPTAYELVTIGKSTADERTDVIANLASPLDAAELLAVLDEIAAIAGDGRMRNEPSNLISAQTLFAGESATIRRLVHHVDVVARSETAVCIFGDDGSGRSIVARAVHDRSARAGQPFVAFNAAAYGDDELCGLLFDSGGAAAQRSGTVFIDRLGMAGRGTQRKLLQLLQAPSDGPTARVIAGMRPGTGPGIGPPHVLPDLYYRVKVLELEVPRLRDRANDIEPIAREMLARSGHTSTLTAESLHALQHYSFPGNLIELAHALIHATVLAQGSPIRPEHLPTSIRREQIDHVAAANEMESLDVVVKRFERDYVLQVLRAVAGNRGRAAGILGLSRKGLWGKLKSLGITNADIQLGAEPPG